MPCKGILRIRRSHQGLYTGHDTLHFLLHTNLRLQYIEDTRAQRQGRQRQLSSRPDSRVTTGGSILGKFKGLSDKMKKLSLRQKFRRLSNSVQVGVMGNAQVVNLWTVVSFIRCKNHKSLDIEDHLHSKKAL